MMRAGRTVFDPFRYRGLVAFSPSAEAVLGSLKALSFGVVTALLY